MTPEQQFELIRDIVMVVVGALLALGSGLVLYWLEGKREQRRLRLEEAREKERERKRWQEKALNWAVTGRKESLRRAVLPGADLHGVDLGPGEGREDGADLSLADLSKANLHHATLHRAHLEGAILREAILILADLQEAMLWSADLQGANLKLANLQGAELWGANLRGAKLVGAKLQGAGLWSAKFQGAVLSGAKLQGARADENTIWPEGFEVPEGVVMEDY